MSLRFNSIPFFAPVDTETGGDLTVSKIEEFLKDDNVETDDKEVIDLKPEKVADKDKSKDEEDEEEEPKKKKEDEEDDELKEIEEELEEPDDEKLELTTPVRRKEILKKYPNLFKDFPYLEKAYYREQQFTELLPTIDDAKEAVAKAQTLDYVEQDLMSGNTEKLLLAAKQDNPQAFNKIVDNYLAVLHKVDEKAHNHVVGNIIKHTIIAMVKEGRASSNEALSSAATLLHQFVFGSSDFVPPTKLTSDEEPKEDPIKSERAKFMQERFEVARDDLNDRVQNLLRNTIEQNIDPKESMTSYIKRNATREAMELLEESMSKDTRFKLLIDKLWEKALSENLSKSSLDKIRSACVSKAKTLLPSVIQKARNEAMKGTGKRVRDDDNEREEKSSNKRASAAPSKEKQKIPSKMSTLDYLMQED